MSGENLDRYFDGTLSLSDLTPEERAEVARLDRAIATLRRDPETVPPRIRAAVMRQVRAEAQVPWRRAWLWAVTPRTVRLSPFSATALAAAAVALMVLAWPDAEAPSASPPVVPAASATARFVFVAPDARSVAVTGDFVRWDPTGIPLRDVRGDGVWVAEVELTPGAHQYVFVVDGTEWRPDPNAVSQVDDGFGQRNSVLLVAAGSS